MNSFRCCGLAAACGLFLQAAGVEWEFSALREGKIVPAKGTTELTVSPAAAIGGNPKFPELSGLRFPADDVVVCRAASTPEINLTDRFQLEAVFRADAVQGYRTICWKGDRTGVPQRIQYYLSIFNGRLEFKFMDQKGEWRVGHTAGAEIDPEEWVYAAVLFDGGKLRIFINGAEAAVVQPTPALPELVASDDPLYVGVGAAASEFAWFNFEGVIRALRFTPGVTKPVLDAKFTRLAETGRKARLSELDAAVAVSRKAPAALPEAAALQPLAAQAEEARKAVKADPASRAARSRYAAAVAVLRQELSRARNRADWRSRFAGAAGERDFALFTLPTGQGFKRGGDYFRLFEDAGPKTLKAARRESESFQIVCSAAPGKAVRLALGFSGFRSPEGRELPAGVVRWGEIKDITAVRTELGSYFNGKNDPAYLGSWPDMVVDDNPGVIDIPAGEDKPLLFRVDVPLDAAPGSYAGVFTAVGPGGRFELPVTLVVRRFELPETNSIPVSFSFFVHLYRDWYGWEELTPERSEYLNRFLSSYRIPLCNIYRDDLYPALGEIEKDRHNFATAGYLDYKHPLSERELDDLIARFRPRLEAVEAAGLQDRVYLYAFDEIVGMGGHDKSFPPARQVMPRFKAEFPWLKRVQTSKFHPELADCFDIWVPLFHHLADYSPELETLRAAGKEVWWYPADAPAEPHVNFFLGYPALNLRVVMTMTYMKGIQGILYWCVNREWQTNMGIRDRWPADTAAWNPAIISVLTKEEVCRNGMGNLMYPGPDGRIYPSLRLENLRDGIEDYEYYQLLKSKLAELRRKQPDSPLIAEAEAQLRVPAGGAVDVMSYSRSPYPLIRQHDALGDRIDEIEQALTGR